jgi:hypothetical protein
MTNVEVNGWRAGFKSISFIKLIRTVGTRHLDLAQAKNLVDELILGHPFTLAFETESDAVTFVRVADELGVLASWPAPRRSRC